MIKLYILHILVMCVLSVQVNAQLPIISFDPAIPASPPTGLNNIVDLVNAGDGSNRLFIVQRTGVIRVYKDGALLSPEFLNMSSLVLNSGSQGLLSVAFHPDYKNNGHFYVYYNCGSSCSPSPSGSIRVSRYTVSGNPDVADASSRVDLLIVTKPFNNHNGGKLNFGPDGYLYFTLGDGGYNLGNNIGDPGNRSQSGNTLLGKMVRINVTNVNTPPYYSIPADNPYVDVAGTEPHIWARGLRNPWRWSFDRQTGDIWIADVGHDTQEEVNFIPAGSTGGLNFGWRCYEGKSVYNSTIAPCTSPLQDTVRPVFSYAYTPQTGRCIIGGYVYRGLQFLDLKGYYICTDNSSGNGWLIDQSDDFTATRQTGWPLLTTFGEAEDGELYAASGNVVYRVMASGATLPLNLLSFAAIKQNGSSLVKWSTSDEVNTDHFEIEKSTDGVFFVKLGTLAAGNLSGNYSYTDNNNHDNGIIYYRIRIVDTDGEVDFSAIARVVIGARDSRSIYPSVISDRVLNIYTDNGAGLRFVELVNALGNRVMVKQLNPNQPSYRVSLPVLPGGVYFVKLFGTDHVSIDRVIIK